jgi:GT2 family glycosyltransferase
MTKDIKVSVIVVNYNGEKWIKKCLDSVIKQTYTNIEIIVIDNNSTDTSNDIIDIQFPMVVFYQMGYNAGFANAVNKGIEMSRGEYIFLFNLDAWIEPTVIENLLKEKDNKNFDVIAPLEYSYDQKSLKKYRYATTIDNFGHPINIKDSNNSFYLLGACILFSKSFYITTKGLDNNFFMYCEEVDWFWRLQLCGKKIGYSVSEKIYHAGAGSTGKGIKYNVFLWRNQNTLQMLLKNYRWHNLLWVLPIYLSINVAEMIFFLFLGKPKISLSYLQGLRFNVVHLPRTLKKREWVQKNRKITDREVMRYMYPFSAKLVHLYTYFKK